ncbi:MAG: hypothetical protein J6A92_03185 [Lachnospiraceae bacterium]|nr:hypothetical protein [Lachnospiraceae bacterium]
MIIESGNVAMTSRRSYDRTVTATSSLSLWGSGFSQDNVTQVTSQYHEESGTDNESSSTETSSSEDIFQEFMQAQSISSPVTMSKTASDLDTIRQQSITYLLRLLFGKETASPLDRLREQINSLRKSNHTTPIVTGGNYTESTYFSEKESTSFSTTGTVKTADGREFSFNLSLTMSRSFTETYAKSISFGEQPQVCDPLVINVSANTASVSDQKFFFDLDADGSVDKISKLSAGSGFLALDKNNDGMINNGTELFGTQSGDGFVELAAYDEDNNGWIDEADAIFDRLRIWTKDANGNDVLCALGKAGVGAIYLGHQDTEFSLNSAKDNSANALIRKTGIFLYENGGCGTIQHLDMVV